MIGIDEAQFFGDLYEFCCKVADDDGKTVIVAGLDGDYLRCLVLLCDWIFKFFFFKTILLTVKCGFDFSVCRRSFGAVLDIIPIADSVTKLTARCEVCGHKAFFTLRKNCDTRTELIGGADVYMPVCRKHYITNHIKASKKVFEDSDKARPESCVAATI